MRPIEHDAVLFDLDGTLIDSGADIAAAANVALVAVGRHPLPPSIIRGFVGDGAPRLIARCLGDDASRLDEALAAWRQYYGVHALDRTTCYPGITSLLDALEPRPLGVVSNKPEPHCRRILEGLGIAPHFGAVIGGDTVPEKKPHPQPLVEAARRLGVPPGRCVMVGDGPQDIEAGRRAGMVTVGCAWGFRPTAELLAAGADHLADEIATLAALLLS